jgi:hypothetical protein
MFWNEKHFEKQLLPYFQTRFKKKEKEAVSLEKEKRKRSYIVVHKEFGNMFSYEIVQSLGCIYAMRYVFLAKFSNL